MSSRDPERGNRGGVTDFLTIDEAINRLVAKFRTHSGRRFLVAVSVFVALVIVVVPFARNGANPSQAGASSDSETIPTIGTAPKTTTSTSTTTTTLPPPPPPTTPPTSATTTTRVPSTTPPPATTPVFTAPPPTTPPATSPPVTVPPGPPDTGVVVPSGP